MIAVATTTGKIGSQILAHLLRSDAAVRVILRDPSKLPPEIRNQVEIVPGSLDDEGTLEMAFNDEAHYLRFIRPAIKAVKSQGVKRVVLILNLEDAAQIAEFAEPRFLALNAEAYWLRVASTLSGAGKKVQMTSRHRSILVPLACARSSWVYANPQSPRAEVSPGRSERARAK